MLYETDGCRMKHLPLLPLCMILGILSCSLPRQVHPPETKWPASQLQEDLAHAKRVMEACHPSLYAYLPKEDWELSYQALRSSLQDSLTTHQFLYGSVLPFLAQIRCGHTQATYPRGLSRHFRESPPPAFPLFLRCWSDTMMVLSQMGEGDNLVPRGALVTSIDGMAPAEIRDRIFQFLPSDGYSQHLSYHRLSTSFPSLYRNIFGLRASYRVGLRLPDGRDTLRVLPNYVPAKPGSPLPRGDRARRQDQALRFFHDTLSGAAVLRVSTFDQRLGMRRFYRRSFRAIRRTGIRDLIIDIRTNGGGYVDQQAQLARYLKRNVFRVADTAAAVTRGLGAMQLPFYRALTERLVLSLLTRRGADGKYHLRYWERKTYHPHVRNAFYGRTHLLVAGPTFSAAALFATLMKGEAGLTLLGEETGGGSYASNGLLLPACALPHTGIRLTVPLFRIVPDRDAARVGRGVMPDITVPPTSQSVNRAIDLKFETARRRILESRPPSGEQRLNK